MCFVNRLFLLIIGFTGLLGAQGIQDVANAILLSRVTSTQLFSVTASQGDGSTIKLVKNSGQAINATLSWVAVTGNSLQSAILRGAGTAPSSVHLGGDGVTCMIGINPTSTAVAMGAISSIPPNGVGWTCTTNITGAAQTTPVSGTAVWP